VTGDHGRPPPVARPPILATKLRPTTGPRVEVSARLAGLLRPRIGCLTLVHACAGYGKTTVLAATHHPDWAWYNLDVADRDPATFAQRLSHALCLEPPANNAPGAGEALALELAQRLQGRPTVLTLDRYEQVRYAAELGRFLGELLLLAPALAVRAATRIRPSLPLERLRLADRLVEVGPGDLRLDRPEIADLLAAAWGRPPRTSELDFADTMLGGWPAALQLWAGGLDDDDGDLLAPLQPGQPLHEYLHEEIVETLPEDVFDQVRRDWRWLMSRGPFLKRASNASRRQVADRLVRDRVAVVPGRHGWYVHPLLVAWASMHTSRPNVTVPPPVPEPVTDRRPDEPAEEAGSPLTVRAFGSLAVLIDGEEVPGTVWPASARRLLELLLSLQGGRTTATDAAQTLWPQHTARAARNSFNVALHGLRRALEPQLTDGARSRYVVREGRQYRLCVERLTCDAEQFTQLVHEVPTTLDDAGGRLLQAAVDLYTEDFLASCDEPFAEVRRSRLRGLLLGGLEKLGQWYAATGRGDLAVPALRRLVALEPSRHMAWERLLELQADAPDQLASTG
jgi:DNA-binding SARP family transcriptional activator